MMHFFIITDHSALKVHEEKNLLTKSSYKKLIRFILTSDENNKKKMLFLVSKYIILGFIKFLWLL